MGDYKWKELLAVLSDIIVEFGLKMISTLPQLSDWLQPIISLSVHLYKGWVI